MLCVALKVILQSSDRAFFFFLTRLHKFMACADRLTGMLYLLAIA
jgi:hypothetical protein